MNPFVCIKILTYEVCFIVETFGDLVLHFRYLALMAAVAAKGTSQTGVNPNRRSTVLVAWVFSYLVILVLFSPVKMPTPQRTLV